MEYSLLLEEQLSRQKVCAQWTRFPSGRFQFRIGVNKTDICYSDTVARKVMTERTSKRCPRPFVMP